MMMCWCEMWSILKEKARKGLVAGGSRLSMTSRYFRRGEAEWGQMFALCHNSQTSWLKQLIFSLCCFGGDIFVVHPWSSVFSSSIILSSTQAKLFVHQPWHCCISLRIIGAISLQAIRIFHHPKSWTRASWSKLLRLTWNDGNHLEERRIHPRSFKKV